MTFDIFTGDPAVFLADDGNGGDQKYVGGQPVMDQGLENQINIQLNTEEDWPGNIFMEPDEKVGSDFAKKSNTTITIKSLNDIQNSAYRALKYMLDIGLATDIVVRASNPESNKVKILIQIYMPTEMQEFIATSNGQAWHAQRYYPAHERT